MPFGDYTTPKAPTIPTFLQYLKTASPKGVEEKTKFAVEIIWLPGKFDNVTLQTHAFRYIATPNNPLYKDVQEYVSSLVESMPRLEIVIVSFEEKAIRILENAKKPIRWDPLGSNALKAIES